MQHLKHRAKSAFFWDFSGKLAMQGMSFITSIFLARLLEPSDFGLVAMVMVIIGIAGIFSDVGLGSALIQRRRVLSIHYSSVFFFNLAIGSLLTLLTFFSAKIISNFYSIPALKPLVEVVSFSFVIGAFSSVQSTKLRKELEYALLTKMNFISSLISGVFGISLAFYGAGVWSLVVQAMSQGILYNIFIWTSNRWKPKAEFSIKALIHLWAFGFRLFVSGFLDTIVSKLDTIIIAKLFSPATLGFFNRAKSLDQMVITYSSGSLMSVLFPVLSKLKNDLPRFQNVIIKSMGIIVFVVFFLMGGLYLISHELIILLFGEKWLLSVDYFRILILSGFGYPISALLVNILSSRGNSKAFLRLEIYKKIILSANLVVGFVWGIEGYLYGLLVATTIGVLLNIYFSSREIDLTKMQFIKPILFQMMLTVTLVVFVQFLNINLKHGLIFMFIIKVLEYSIFYILVNKILKTSSYIYLMSEVKPVLNKLLKRVRR